LVYWVKEEKAEILFDDFFSTLALIDMAKKKWSLIFCLKGQHSKTNGLQKSWLRQSDPI
jgi:hypothetical protein